MVDLTRKADETLEEEYVWRIGQAKENGLFDGTWETLTPAINAQCDREVNESVWRKMYASGKKWQVVFGKMQPNECEQSMRDAARDLKIERAKLATEKLENNKWIREYARDELITEKIVDALSSVTPLSPPSASGYTTIYSGDREAILAFGDEHFGAEFEIRGLRGEIINAYSPEIFEQRMQDLLNQTIAIIAKENISSLVVMELGDYCDGILRAGQLMKLRYGVVDSSIKYALYMADWLNELSAYVPIRFQMAWGNHSSLRLLEPKNQFDTENMTKVVLEIIKARLAGNSNVEIVENPSGLVFDCVNGVNLLGVHGETKDMEKALKDFSLAYGVSIGCLLAGHLHHNQQETVGIGVETIRVPSIIGVDSYAMKLNRTSKPGATLFFLENGLGKTQEYSIKL